MYILDTAGITAFEDLRNYKDPEKVYEEDEFLADFLNKIEQGKADINNIYVNYLPLYNQIITYTQKTERDMQSVFLNVLSKPKEEIPATSEQVIENIADDNINDGIDGENYIETEPPEPPPVVVSARLLADDNFHRYYTFEPYQFLDRWVLNPNDHLRSKFNRQVEGINKIAAADANVNFYVYVCTRMQDTEYSREIVPEEFSTLDYFNEFINSIEGADGIGWLDIDTVEKRVEKVFRTDHHWSAMGAYSAYVDIINMMNKVTPEIGEPVPLNSEYGLITFEDVKMRGSFAATLRFDDYYESFSVLDITLPTFTDPRVHIDAYDRYIAGNADKGKFTCHYSAYYNSSGQRKYTVKDSNTGRNLLLIGDSYSWWFSWIITAHFDNVYIYLPPWDKQQLDYIKFISDNKITDVLLMQFSDRLLFNYYSDSAFSKIRINQ